MKKVAPSLLLLSVYLIINLSGEAQTPLSIEIQGVADQLASKVNHNPGIKNIAVADFTNVNETPTELGKFLSDQFLYSLASVRGTFSVIDRSRVNALLREVGLYAKGLLDPEAATRLGRLKGIDVIVVGTVVEDGNDILVTVKAIRLESAAIVGVAKGEITRTPVIRDLETKDINEVTGDNSISGVDQPSGNKSKTLVRQKTEVDGISAELLACRQSGQGVECLIKVMSMNKDVDLGIYVRDSRIIDASTGYEFKMSQIKLADVSGSSSYVQKSLVADYPINVSCMFSPVTHRITQVSKLELVIGDFNKIIFRNIPVQQQ